MRSIIALIFSKKTYPVRFVNVFLIFFQILPYSAFATSCAFSGIIEEVESRATKRRLGYVEAFKAAAAPDPDGLHLVISDQALRELWRSYTSPGLGVELLIICMWYADSAQTPAAFSRQPFSARKFAI